MGEDKNVIASISHQSSQPEPAELDVRLRLLGTARIASFST